MGGKTGMHTALTHPERVSKLIVIDMTPLKLFKLFPDYYIQIQGYLSFMKNIDLKNKSRKIIEQ